MSKPILRIGTRGSALALWQAHFTQDQLKKHGVESELVIIKTQGDKIQNIGFDKMEGKGFFTKEIEAALLENKVDLAVHSHKDLETSNPEGLKIAGVSYRAEHEDLILVREESVDENQKWSIKEGATLGTSSARRKNLVKYFRSDIVLDDLRGNVPTRVEKLREGKYDAIILAAAGLNRLNIDLSGLRVVTPEMNEFVPAPAQGVLAWQIREDDAFAQSCVDYLHNQKVQDSIAVERGLMKAVGGGCQIPFGALCTYENGAYNLEACYSEKWEDVPTYFSSKSTDSKALMNEAVQFFQSKKKS